VGGMNVASVSLQLCIENNSKFVRGRKRSIQDIEHYILSRYHALQRPRGLYELQVPYRTDAELDERVYEILNDISQEADGRHCFSESEARDRGHRATVVADVRAAKRS
jgi:hypothetical protein